MANSDPYSRHYWRLVDDPKFAEIYSDDHHYATWSRLLMVADQAWPATAHLPSLCRRTSIAKLAEVGLIDLLPNGRFRMHGLDAERDKRGQSGRNAAAVRWHGEGIARREEKRKEETSITRAKAPVLLREIVEGVSRSS